MTYSKHIDNIRKEYPAVKQELFLDHAGAALFANSLIQRSGEALMKTAYGNPHSKSPASERSTEVVDSTRLKVLKMFNADPAEYAVVFTANATAAVKLVGEGLSSQKDTQYVYLNDSHTSLLGLRGLADQYKSVNEDDMENEIRNAKGLTLFSWPGQSNFSGQRYPSHKWCKRATMSKSNVYTLVDAAAEASTHPIDLSFSSSPDFVALSFYKIFGYPDLGALLVRKNAGREFFKHRVYFGGGTVESLTAFNDFAPRHTDISSKLEDGTVPFHSILTLSCAIDLHYELYDSFDKISSHVNSVSGFLFDKLNSLHHSNGKPLVHVYSAGEYHDSTKQGPIVSFNLLNEHGDWIGYADFAKLSSEAGINIRTGTHCNSGATSQWVGITENEIMENHAKGHVCGDDHDVMNGVPTGAIRASFGACSDYKDAQVLVDFLREYYIDQHTTLGGPSSDDRLQYVESLTVYPIKSCGGFQVPDGLPWQLTPEGLKWDREFCLVNLSSESVMSLKKHPRMAMVSPEIDEHEGELRVSCGTDSVEIPLFNVPTDMKAVTTTLCGDKVPIQLYRAEHVVEFFSNAIGIDCTLGRFPDSTMRYYKPHLNGPMDGSQPTACMAPVPISMSNSSPLLLISQASVDQLGGENHTDVDPDVFRANIKIAGNSATSLEPFAEDSWTKLQINRTKFKVLGPCRRCNMVGVDSKTGKHNNKPYLALHKTRKMRGQLFFGQHVALDDGNNSKALMVRVGDEVRHYV